jgi:hypothetical protein
VENTGNGSGVAIVSSLDLLWSLQVARYVFVSVLWELTINSGQSIKLGLFNCMSRHDSYYRQQPTFPANNALVYSTGLRRPWHNIRLDPCWIWGRQWRGRILSVRGSTWKKGWASDACDGWLDQLTLLKLWIDGIKVAFSECWWDYFYSKISLHYVLYI